MKNYVMTKNYAKTFKLLAITFVILAVVTAVAIPLSLSQQIADAKALEQQNALEAQAAAQPVQDVQATGATTDNRDGEHGHDHEHDDDHSDEAWKSQITPLTAMNYVIIGAAIVLMSVLVLVYWLNVVAWLYKSAVNANMNKSLWAILGVFFNIVAVGAFCIVLDQPKRS